MKPETKNKLKSLVFPIISAIFATFCLPIDGPFFKVFLLLTVFAIITLIPTFVLVFILKTDITPYIKTIKTTIIIFVLGILLGFCIEWVAGMFGLIFAGMVLLTSIFTIIYTIVKMIKLTKIANERFLILLSCPIFYIISYYIMFIIIVLIYYNVN